MLQISSPGHITQHHIQCSLESGCNILAFMAQKWLCHFIFSAVRHQYRTPIEPGILVTHSIFAWCEATAFLVLPVHSLCSLSCDRSTASSKLSSPECEIQCCLSNSPLPLPLAVTYSFYHIVGCEFVY